MHRLILGDSKPVRDLLKMISRVAAAKTNILILGESGTGKELVARQIHESGPLKGKAFVPVNCGAIPENLIESEMFGHRRGSFTGAVNEKTGLFEAANGGTLFLDEVGELPLGMQVKLLRAIQERSFKKVGGTDDIKVDVRIIAATNQDLEATVARGTFREDLYYRLNVIQIRTPPLRERPGDVELLAKVFLTRFCEKQSKSLGGFELDAIEALKSHAWPGNVRELENVVERAVTLESEPTIQLHSLPQVVLQSYGSRSGGPPSAPRDASDEKNDHRGGIHLPAPDFSHGPLKLEQILGQVEKTYILAALHHAGRSSKKAADLLGVTYRNFRYRLKELGIRAMDEE